MPTKRCCCAARNAARRRARALRQQMQVQCQIVQACCNKPMRNGRLPPASRPVLLCTAQRARVAVVVSACA